MKINTLPIREIVFGLEDGIVSTLGVLVGIAIGTNDRALVILSGLVVIFVESLSMAAGTYLSNKSQQEFRLAEDNKNILKRIFHPRQPRLPIRESAFMGVSYITGGLVSLLSFLVLPVSVAVVSAVLISFVSLFGLGFVKGKLTKINPVKSGLEMVLVSASASLIGFTVGKLAPILLDLQ